MTRPADIPAWAWERAVGIVESIDADWSKGDFETALSEATRELASAEEERRWFEAVERIARALMEAAAAKVKPLGWGKTVDGHRGPERREQWQAKTPFEDYFIWHYQMPVEQKENGPRFTVTPFRIFSGEHFETLDEAKAAAQADYERRILSALITPPETVSVVSHNSENLEDKPGCLSPGEAKENGDV